MNPYATIRAALELAGEYIRSDLASERGAFEGHEGVSRIDEIKIDLANNADALTALAELERAASEPVAYQYAHPYFGGGKIWRQEQRWNGHTSDEARALYAAPPAPVAEIRDVVVTDEMCDRAYIGKWRGVPELIGHEPDDEDRQWSREWLEAWRSELGPALGLVEIREPTPEECERICTEYERLLMREGTCGGRDAFDAVRAVMWPKSEGS